MRFGITSYGQPLTSTRCPSLEQRALTAPAAPNNTVPRPALSFRSSDIVDRIADSRDDGPAVFGESVHGLDRRRSTRSVRFATQSPERSLDMGSRAEEEVSPHGQRTAESSGDEITPIISRELGGASNYNATSSTTAARDRTASPPHEQERGASYRGSGSGVRTRAKQKRKRRSAGSGSGEAAEEAEERWWSKVVEKFGGVELDNKGSVARDHLALERTFLAWLRTSLAFASIGIAITQLFRLNTTISEREGYKPDNPPNTYNLRQVGKPLGATFLAIAIVVLAVGARRYFESQYWIIRGKFPASRGSIFLITAVAVALVITSLVVVLTVDPSVFEKR